MYRIGKVSEMKQVKGKIPVTIYQEVLRIVSVLDKYYGEDRDIYQLYGICIMMADINHIANNSLKIATIPKYIT